MNFLEFAPAKNEPNREFLVGFSFDPIVEVALSRGYKQKDAVITALALNYRNSLEVMDKVIKISGISNMVPSLDVFEAATQMQCIEKDTLYLAKEIAKELKTEMHLVWGAVQYATLLINYHKIPSEESMKKAFKKFGIKNQGFKF